MNYKKLSSIAATIAAGGALMVAACSREDVVSMPTSRSDDTGKVGMNLVLPTGDTISSANMKIYTGTSATGTPVVNNSFDVSGVNSLIDAFAGDLAAPAANTNYFVVVTATGLAGGSTLTCNGSQGFTVSPNSSTTVNVPLSCAAGPAAPTGKGMTDITATPISESSCPFLTNTSVAPRHTNVGHAVHLMTDPQPLGTLLWTATPGTIITNATGNDATFTCPSAGTFTIQVELKRPGNAGCDEKISTDVVCLGAGDGGSGGAGGAGGNGGSGGDQVCAPIGKSPPAGTTCTDCEANACPPDNTGCGGPVTDPMGSSCAVQPDCADYPTQAMRDSCNAVVVCMRQTNCIAGGNTSCYCGTLGAAACKAAATVVNGACASQIKAAFPSSFANLDIFNNIGVAFYPGGGALSLGQCDLTQCGASSANECTPYCTGGSGGAGGSGGVGGSGGCVCTGGVAGSGGSGGVGGSGGTGGGTGGAQSDPICSSIGKSPPAGTTCTDCELGACPYDNTGCSGAVTDPMGSSCSVQPACSDYPTVAMQNACNAVVVCMRQTNCIAGGNTSCYCGTFGAAACKAAATVVNGACASQIKAAFPAAFTNADIFNNIGVAFYPAGGALSLGQCDLTQCGAASLNECTPYCQ